MADNKKVLTIQDISCYGQCSTTVALPILSAFGFETAILPTAILSTHTCGFTDYTVLDLTDEMPKIIEHWKSEHITFDVIYTGYVSNRKQFEYIKEAREYLLAEGGLFIVDPAMADNGKMYPGLDEDIIAGMMELCENADYILPNITEACFLTHKDYIEIQDDSFINELIASLFELGCKNVILTGYQDDEYSIGAVAYDGLTKTTILKEKEEQSYHGTGDIFSSVFIAYILQGRSIKAALDFSTDFIIDAIENTMDDQFHSYGVKYEPLLKDYINKTDPRY